MGLAHQYVLCLQEFNIVRRERDIVWEGLDSEVVVCRLT
jgi:hypothetical protein